MRIYFTSLLVILLAAGVWVTYIAITGEDLPVDAQVEVEAPAPAGEESEQAPKPGGVVDAIWNWISGGEGGLPSGASGSPAAAKGTPSWVSNSPNIVHTTEQDFDRDVLQAPGPVVVEFWTATCSWCEKAEPKVVSLADELSGSVKFVKVRADICKQITNRYKINSVPTLVLFENGSNTKSVSGDESVDNIRKRLGLPGGPEQTDPSTRTVGINLVNTTDQDFAGDVLNSDMPVVVEFWRPSCPQCVKTEPEVVRLAAELDGRVKVVKVNTDDCPDACRSYHITGVPTLILFKGGKATKKELGGGPVELIKQQLGL